MCRPIPPPDGEEATRRSPWPAVSPLAERIDEITDRVQQAGADHAERAAALEEYLALAHAHDDEEWFYERALEQLRPLRASCLSALGRPADEIQQRAAQSERT
jgi:hypothetical protein